MAGLDSSTCNAGHRRTYGRTSTIKPHHMYCIKIKMKH